MNPRYLNITSMNAGTEMAVTRASGRGQRQNRKAAA
jgi:hypothetical protein